MNGQKAEELARLLVRHPQWQWKVGMRLRNGMFWYRIVSDAFMMHACDGPPYDRCTCSDEGLLCVRQKLMCGDDAFVDVEEFDSSDAIPDLDDAATLGVLFRLLVETNACNERSATYQALCEVLGLVEQKISLGEALATLLLEAWEEEQ